MATNFIGVLLANSPTYTVNTGFSTQLYDAYGDQTINVQTGASLSLLGSMGANTVRLSGNASAWQVYRDGSTAMLLNTDGSRIELAANTTTQTLQFDDRSIGLSINTSGGAPAVVLGSQTLGTAAVAITAAGGTSTPPTTPEVGSAVKAPWTLMMHGGVGSYYSTPNSGGIFSSDGTATGTSLNALAGWYAPSTISSSGVRFKTTADSSKAYFYSLSGSGGGLGFSYADASSVGVTDGTASGTTILMNTASGNSNAIPATFTTVLGSQLVMAGGQQYPTQAGKVLVSDGTVAGTTLQSTPYAVPGQSNPANYSELIIKGINDPANQAAWFSASTAPYGSELIRFSYATGTTPSTVMVKDIYPGSLSGVGDVYSGVTGALLPNGKLVFAAYDDVSSLEPWVSDGTDAGTFLLADLVAGAGGSGPISFTNFGSKVAFSAISSYGRGLVFTDGTSAGTTVLDVNPSGSANPIILGQANGLLYFTATTSDYSTPLQGIYSTNGTTFTRLADINSSASLLGWNASKAFFNVSDATNGAELWAADLTNGSFALVKDILPGSGSALSQSYTTNASMVGGKLVFNAYTSATQQKLFVSDGTDAGTVQLSSSLPNMTKVVGGTMVFANSDGIYGVAVGAATPQAVQLVSAATAGTTTTLAMQNDADQVFFKTSNGDLYVTNGVTAGTLKLAGSVENFKVLAENAVFFVQKSTTVDAALWYSDGTAAGTRFVEALPANFNYDLDNAVALRTAGALAPLDTTAPLFGSAVVNGNSLTLTYTDTNGLDASHPPATSAFTLSGTTATVSSVAVDSAAKTVVLTLSQAVTSTDTVTFSYTDPTIGNDASAIQDATGNDAANLQNYSVINRTAPPDVTGPLLNNATVNANVLTLRYTDANSLDVSNLPAASAFALSGTSATVSSVTIDNALKTVVLTLSESVKSTDVVSVSYTDPTSGNDVAAIQDSAGNDAASLVNRSVQNQTADNVAPVFMWAMVYGSTLTLNYSDTNSLDESNLPAASAFVLSGTNATVSSVTIDNALKTVVLTLSESVKSTDVVSVSYTDPTSGNDVAAIQDSAGNDAASLVNHSVQNQTADNVAPVLSSAVVNGITLTLSYTDASPLDSSRLPAASAFTLSGTSATVTGVAVDGVGQKVMLTLSQAVTSSDTVNVSYTDPTSGNDVAAIQDILGNDAASLVNRAVANQTSERAPWTLLVATQSGLYASDGTADGSGYTLNAYLYGRNLLTNADHSVALLRADIYNYNTSQHELKVFGISNATSAPELLAQNIYPYGTIYQMGNKWVLSNEGSTTFSGLLTDGTLAGSTVLANVPSGIVDAANQVIWGRVSTVPYGNELFRSVVSDTGITTTMVKDIWPGSSSGYQGGGALLPNGKLIFSANDGVNGRELWSSDGTEAGTSLLADLYGGSDSAFGWSSFVNFGNQVVFSVYVAGSAVPNQSGTASGSAGYQLVVTDGTSSGTSVLQVAPGQNSNPLDILGQANNLLYFTATAPVNGVDTQGIYSTNGTTFTRLADINSSANLLGWNASKAFFNVSDATRGEELWVADLVGNGGLTLVKDILAGTGSSTPNDAQMVGDKLVFNAYTSATQQSLFVSDGTDAGTVQLSNSSPTLSKLVGDTLVFATAGGVYSVDVASATPSTTQLVNAANAGVTGSLFGTSPTASLMQTDADQVFFKTSNGDLYATKGGTSDTVKLAGTVTNFKVVAENAIYFVETDSASATSLWYSDGTATGTRFVEALPANISYDLDNAVAIITVGVSG